MKPIVLKTWEVQAILGGEKTTIRRVVKNRRGTPDYLGKDRFGGVDRKSTGRRNRLCAQFHNGNDCFNLSDGKELISETNFWAPCEPGDVLYVQEAWKSATIDPAGGGYALQDICLYKADEPIDETGMMAEGRWHTPITMPVMAARLFLRVSGVRVEKLQDITEDGVLEEVPEKLLSCPREMTIYYPEGGAEPCWNAGTCGRCDFITRSYEELFGDLVWDENMKPKDRAIYGWASNPWVWVIKFERITKKEAWA